MRDNELYQEMILDHYKNPRNCCSMQDPTHTASGDNPLCGDQLEVFLNIGVIGHGRRLLYAALDVEATGDE